VQHFRSTADPYYTPSLTGQYFSLYVELQLILKFAPKKWGSGEGGRGDIGSIMSIIGKHCQWVIVFSDTVRICI